MINFLSLNKFNLIITDNKGGGGEDISARGPNEDIKGARDKFPGVRLNIVDGEVAVCESEGCLFSFSYG